ncbi:acyltransferase family protein [Limosilactobacillus reuteri]
MNNSKVFTGVDIVKLASAIGVISIHTTLPFFNILGRLGVPFFAIVSSFFFFKKFNCVKEWTMQKNVIFNFCKRIFLLYFVWQCFYIPLAIVKIKSFLSKLNYIDIKTIFTSIIYFFFPALYNSKNIDVTYDLNGWGPSWYLLAVMIGIPMFVIFLKIFNSNKLIIGSICVCLEIYFILSNEFGFISHFSPLMTHTFIRLFIYFFIGYIFALEYKKGKISLNKKKTLYFTFIIMLSLFIIENILIHHFGGKYTSEEVITTVPTSILLSLVAFNWNPQIDKSIHLRNLSTFLYCVQVWPITVIRKTLSILGLTGLYFIQFMFVISISILLYYIYIFFQKKYKQSLLQFMV